ncbi:MAG TPA: DUF459 domain-containing protein [Candidatus Dormibacteraeota bacterium]|nr:DUF459 domain-containing protein [Candidatus Dormibacteraeota bacterium]
MAERPAGTSVRAHRARPAGRTPREAAEGTRSAGPPADAGDPNWLNPVVAEVVPVTRLATPGRIASLGAIGVTAPARLVDDGTGTPRRRTMGPRQMAVAGAVAAVLGLLLNAGALQRSEEAAPYGAGRTIALTILGPLATVAHDTGLDLPRAGLDSAFGDDAGSASSSVAADSVPPPGAPQGGLTPSAATAATGLDDRRDSAPRSGLVPLIGPDAGGGEPPVPLRVPSPADPLRVWVGGDSVAGYLGLGMVELAGQTGDLAVHSHYQVSTGITRPDYYDWPAHLEDDMHRYNPEVVVFLAGANDDQPITTPGGGVADFGSPAWAREYARRVGALMDRIRSENRIAVWVGLPVMRSTDFDGRMQTITAIDREEAAQRPGVVFVDGRGDMSSPAGGYAAYLPDASGHEILMRASDGIHLSPDGGRRLAAMVVAEIRRDLADGGAP